MSNKSYTINFESFSRNFSLPKAIIDEKFDSLDPAYLKVILLIFRNSDKNYSVSLLANLLNISQEKVSKAIDYWIDKSVLLSQKSQSISNDVVILSTSATKTNSIINQSKELTFLMECMENLLARPVTSTEQKTIQQILEFVRLPADVILMAVDYCASIDKANPRYIEKVCMSWAEKGIVTHELAEQYLNLLKQTKINEEKVKKLFELDNHNLTENEHNFINKWLNEFKFDLDTIKLAYDKTMTAINKPAFAYINTILISWNEKGYHSYAEIAKNEGGKLTNKSKKTTSYDIDELDSFWDNVPKID